MRERDRELRRRRHRKEKLRKLRKKYTSAQSEAERQAIWAKVQKIAPWLTLQEFLAPLTPQQTSPSKIP
ncbi:MAG: hypothetical protein QN198_00130 [Armatimonadota bacterium]|nr:hypothetical protein [Armatimonadota bacterium]MDR5701987.1 hypothetical protein [Armatimonadota bacterium]MDR7434715.1 hypothetical protein [Armatimonadota bacterium]